MPQAGLEPSASHLLTDTGYFRAMQIPLKNGRAFDAHDQATQAGRHGERSFREKIFPESESDRSKSNRRRTSERPKPAREIVGVVGTSRHDTLAEAGEPEL